jgi:hypothetical protein
MAIDVQRRGLSRALVLGLFFGVACGGELRTPLTFDPNEAAAPGVSAGPAPVPKPIKLLELVVNSVTLPKSGADFGLDLIDDGIKRNRLGAIIAALESVLPQADLQLEVTRRLAQGEHLMLFELLRQATAGQLTSVRGRMGVDLDGNPDNNFSGEQVFAVSTSNPWSAEVSARVIDSRLQTDTTQLRLPLPFATGPTAELTLFAAKIQGLVTNAGITSGTVGGLVATAEAANRLVPLLGAKLNQLYSSPETTPQSRELLSDLFDTDQDGQISQAELLNNPGVQTALLPDVDTDGDGQADALSIGVGFTAVPCVITDQATSAADLD